MEYHIIIRFVSGAAQYQIVLTPKDGNPLYGYSGHWKKYTYGYGRETKVFNSYDEAHSYLQRHHHVTDDIVAPQVEAAKVNILFGMLEEMKTTNHILASLYIDLKRLLLFQTEDLGPQPSPDRSEPTLGEERME